MYAVYPNTYFVRLNMRTELYCSLVAPRDTLPPLLCQVSSLCTWDPVCIEVSVFTSQCLLSRHSSRTQVQLQVGRKSVEQKGIVAPFIGSKENMSSKWKKNCGLKRFIIII